MIREIRKKMVILGNRSPFAQHTKDYINHLERVDWIFTNLKLDGSPLTRDGVEKILDGEVVLNARIMDHVLIEKLDNLRSRIYSEESRGSALNQALASVFVREMSSGEAAADLRKSTPTLQEFSYTPVLPPYIDERLNNLLSVIGRKGEFDNPFEKAALLHNEFLAIWPYRENNEVVARALMEFYLVNHGFPMVPLEMSESEYKSCFVDYTRTGNGRPLADYLTRAVRDRLELLIQMTAY